MLVVPQSHEGQLPVDRAVVREQLKFAAQHLLVLVQAESLHEPQVFSVEVIVNLFDDLVGVEVNKDAAFEVDLFAKQHEVVEQVFPDRFEAKAQILRWVPHALRVEPEIFQLVVELHHVLCIDIPFILEPHPQPISAGGLLVKLVETGLKQQVLSSPKQVQVREPLA